MATVDNLAAHIAAAVEPDALEALKLAADTVVADWEEGKPWETVRQDVMKRVQPASLKLLEDVEPLLLNGLVSLFVHQSLTEGPTETETPAAIETVAGASQGGTAEVHAADSTLTGAQDPS